MLSWGDKNQEQEAPSLFPAHPPSVLLAMLPSGLMTLGWPGERMAARGKTFAEFVQQKVFLPLALSSLTFPHLGAVAEIIIVI